MLFVNRLSKQDLIDILKISVDKDIVAILKQEKKKDCILLEAAKSDNSSYLYRIKDFSIEYGYNDSFLIFNMPMSSIKKKKDFYKFMINKFGYDYVYALLVYCKLPANEIVQTIKEKELKEGYK